VLDLEQLGLPMVVALNMSDLAAKRGFKLDVERLATELGVPVVPTVAVRPGGETGLVAHLEQLPTDLPTAPARAEWRAPAAAEIEATQRRVREILKAAGYVEPLRRRALERLDALVMHPIIGLVILAVLLFLIFQAVFSWAAVPMDLIDAGVARLGIALEGALPAGPLRSLLVDGIVAGVGSVLVFLPQILILFLFILVLEDSGYLPRAAYLLDRLMGSVGLSGRAFIPLLSSFACAIPGIMATRTIPNLRDRLATIMIAPLMTCSARLPVYALVIAAFVPREKVGIFNLQGLVLFALYVAGIVGAMAVALVLKRTALRTNYHPLLLELPEYHWPHLNNLLIGLWERTKIFVSRVGTIILALMILLWFLSSYPAPPDGATGPAIQYSFAGMIGRGLEYVFAPIGFNWQISLALVPGLAAREVAVGALGTVYSLSASGDDVATRLEPMIANTWTLATALSLLAWYVFAPQCLSTLAVVRRETNTWRYPLIMATYLFALAYLASFVTYRVALAVGSG
jgi:ferrous iron transport protein B